MMNKVSFYKTGIAFQIKDDLFDVEGDSTLLGKPIGRDAENKNITFVAIFGRKGPEKRCGNIIV